MKSCDPLIRWSGDHMTNEMHYISTSTRHMATKFDMEIASDEWILSSVLHNLLITCTHQITWQIKNVIYQLPWGLGLPNLTGWRLMRRRHQPQRPYDTIVMWWIKNVLSIFLQGSWLHENFPSYRFETQIHIQIQIRVNTILTLATK